MKKQISCKLDARLVARIRVEAEIQNTSSTSIVGQILEDHFDAHEAVSRHDVEELRSILITILATLFTTVAADINFKNIEMQVANITKHFDRIVSASQVES